MIPWDATMHNNHPSVRRAQGNDEVQFLELRGSRILYEVVKGEIS
jgi:hypothetical protein